MKSTRNTQQKKIILEELEKADHPTASELYDAISKKYPTIGRATVFRVLSDFAEKGTVTKFSLTDRAARFDAKTVPHAHVHCLVCGKIFDVEDDALNCSLNKSKLGDFEIYSFKLEFLGCCKQCRDKLN